MTLKTKPTKIDGIKAPKFYETYVRAQYTSITQKYELFVLVCVISDFIRSPWNGQVPCDRETLHACLMRIEGPVHMESKSQVPLMLASPNMEAKSQLVNLK